MNTLDHLMYAGPDLDEMSTSFAAMSGIVPETGGRHTTLGTWNRLLGAGQSSYFELIAPDPQSEVQSQLRAGMEFLRRPQLHRLIFRCSKDDYAALARAYQKAGIEAPVHDLQRQADDGAIIHWKLMIPEPNHYGVFAPLFIDWMDTPHPSTRLKSALKILDCEAGHPQASQLRQLWQELGVDLPLRQADAPYVRVVLQSPKGEIAITSDCS